MIKKKPKYNVKISYNEPWAQSKDATTFNVLSKTIHNKQPKTSQSDIQKIADSIRP